MNGETAAALIAYCRENGRGCPQPRHWKDLWSMLPDRQRKGSGWEPALPLILAAWHDTSALPKMMRLAEHIEWAEKHGALQKISAFLRGLAEDGWHHLGE